TRLNGRWARCRSSTRDRNGSGRQPAPPDTKCTFGLKIYRSTLIDKTRNSRRRSRMLKSIRSKWYRTDKGGYRVSNQYHTPRPPRLLEGDAGHRWRYGCRQLGLVLQQRHHRPGGSAAEQALHPAVDERRGVADRYLRHEAGATDRRAFPSDPDQRQW